MVEQRGGKAKDANNRENADRFQDYQETQAVGGCRGKDYPGQGENLT